MIKKATGFFKAEKTVDMIMALTFVGIIWFRLGTHILMCITKPDVDIAARWIVGLFFATVMILTLIFFGFGTLFESQGEKESTTREEYLSIMKYYTGCIAIVIGIMTPIYLANIQDMTILGYSAVPCLIVVFALYLIYGIKYNEEVDAYDR